MIEKVLEKAKAEGIKVYKRNIENLIAALEKSRHPHNRSCKVETAAQIRYNSV